MTQAGQATPWYLDPITQSFNGRNEKGVDLGVPYHTPVTPLFPGTVTGVKTGPYGQEVDVTGRLNGQPVTASYVHLDQALVGLGMPVGQQSEIGLSGGQLSGGAHPASPAYSSGPHIEFSLWNAGQTPYVGAPINPMSFINAVQGSGGGLLPALDTANSGQALSGAQGFTQASLLGGVLGNFPNVFGPAAGAMTGATGGSTILAIQPPDIAGGLTGAGRNFLSALHVTSLPDLAWRAGLLLLAVILIVVVSQAVAGKETSQETSQLAAPLVAALK